MLDHSFWDRLPPVDPTCWVKYFHKKLNPQHLHCCFLHVLNHVYAFWFNPRLSTSSSAGDTQISEPCTGRHPDCESTYIAHHPQKIALIFSTMCHFSKELKAQGWRVRYHPFQSDSRIRKLIDFIHAQQQLLPATALVLTHCGEHRL